jgi:hypothetical protein
MTFHEKTQTVEITLDKTKGLWLENLLQKISVYNPQSAEKPTNYAQVKADFENQFQDFEVFWLSRNMETLRELGLMAIG